MSTFIMLTRLSSKSLDSNSKQLEKLERAAMDRVHKECPDVNWCSSYAVLGPYDYLDIFEAPDIETATKVSALFRIWGQAHTEIWAATEWNHFKELMHTMKAA